jgi:hypothetical protein
MHGMKTRLKAANVIVLFLFSDNIEAALEFVGISLLERTQPNFIT